MTTISIISQIPAIILFVWTAHVLLQNKQYALLGLTTVTAIGMGYATMDTINSANTSASILFIQCALPLLFLCTLLFALRKEAPAEAETGTDDTEKESEEDSYGIKQLILEETDEVQKEAYLASMQNVEEKDVEQMTHREMLILQLRTLIEQEKIYLKAGLKLDEVAMTLGTNRTYISRMMMETYGHTFSEQMNLFRLESAKHDLLHRPNMSIEAIALSNGFNSANTFNKVFNQHFNCSPAVWRSAEMAK